MPDGPETDAYINIVDFMFYAIRKDPNSPEAKKYYSELHRHGWSTQEIQTRLNSIPFDSTAPPIPTLSGPKAPQPQPSLENLHERFGPQGYRGKMPVKRVHR